MDVHRRAPEGAHKAGGEDPASREGTAVVRRIEQVTTGWLTASLGKRVAAFTASRIGVGQGFLGSLHRLSLVEACAGDDEDDDVTETWTIVAKMAPLEEGSTLFDGVFRPMGIFEREAAFYRQVGPLIGRFCDECDATQVPASQARGAPDSSVVPGCYFAEVSAADGCGIILLEDIRARWSGGRKALADATSPPEEDCRREGLTLPRIQLALRAVAAVHALFFTTLGGQTAASVGTPPFSFLLTGDEPVFIEIVAGFYRESLHKLKRLFGSHLPEHLWKRCDDIMPLTSGGQVGPQPLPDSAESAHSPSRQQPSHAVALCHGDLWSANLMYYTPPLSQREEVALIDWQFANWGNPLADVAFLLYSSVEADLRRANEEHLLRHYHEELSKYLRKRDKDGADDTASRYTFDLCLKDYQRALPKAFIQTISSLEAFLDPESGSAPGPREVSPAIRRLLEMVKEMGSQNDSPLS